MGAGSPIPPTTLPSLEPVSENPHSLNCGASSIQRRANHELLEQTGIWKQKLGLNKTTQQVKSYRFPWANCGSPDCSWLLGSVLRCCCLEAKPRAFSSLWLRPSSVSSPRRVRLTASLTESKARSVHEKNRRTAGNPLCQGAERPVQQEAGWCCGLPPSSPGSRTSLWLWLSDSDLKLLPFAWIIVLFPPPSSTTPQHFTEYYIRDNSFSALPVSTRFSHTPSPPRPRGASSLAQGSGAQLALRLAPISPMRHRGATLGEAAPARIRAARAFIARQSRPNRSHIPRRLLSLKHPQYLPFQHPLALST